ncbi:beta-glucan synthesis-associated, partial [Amanita rubescens]
VVSQSAQFAPFTHDYVYLNDTQDEFVIHNSNKTRPKVRQTVSSLAEPVPSDIFQGSGAEFHTIDFEYWADPNNITNRRFSDLPTRSERYRPSDTGTDGTRVGQRLIPEESMSIVLNLGISRAFTFFLLSLRSLVELSGSRVHQRKGSTNVGCDPAGYPTIEYIDNHIDPYTSECSYVFFFEKGC